MWASSTHLGPSGEVFNLHAVVDWVELQLWNHFDNGFDVFLGVGAFGRQEEASESGEDIDENDSTSIADPAFAFTQPFLPVEWSLVASTSIRQLFFHSEVERLANFREFVLYGDLEQELDNDEGLQIHEDHLTAFKTCQFSAQYLDHCVENLSQRLQHYSDDHHVLADTRAQLTRKNKSWKAQRRRLQKENDDLDLLIATYKRVLEKNERERERRLEKEVSKAQRIEEEKQRFLQRVLKRHQREDYEAFISKFAENRKQRAARRIQAFFRSIKSILQVQRYAVENHAAILLQAVWKRFVHVKEYPHRVESRKQEAEMLLMAQSEGELRQWMAAMEQQQREEAIARAMVFVLAHKTKGTDYHALFSEIDLRKDDVLDRAELRLGAKSFGVRLDRKITRAAAIYESATAFLTVLGKSSTDYRAFRDALAHIFYEFDADRNGELDVDELVTCMSSFNLQLSSENISLLRELFIGDRESDTVGAAEFISFVLAHSSSSSDEDELGLLGYRIREAIMARVSQAQAQAENIEDAVRLVFGAAYKRKDQQRCSIQDFMRVLGRLRLGVTRAQIARLVVRLDRDGDRSISFDELLIWLRMRSKRLADGDLAASPGRATASQMALQIATKKAKALRILLDNLASGSGFSASLTFLESQNLPSMVGDEVLAQLCGVLALPQYSAASVAHEMMALLDLNANGVTTLKEWLTFAQYENTEDGEDPVVIEAMRTALKGSENDDPERLMLWFSELPGDLEEILRLVIKSWQIEHQKISRTDLAADLYKRFDADGNGCLAVRELLQGFMSFGVILTEYEARVLLVAFDLDGDSCWSKSEFMAFVDKLFPTEPLKPGAFLDE
uniref:EF-hand domain-containing protein n=1 Tax=Phytophthora ramorum TaxID=164328 RepID=H3HED6_PHYRM